MQSHSGNTRGVAQLASASGLGPEGPVFESLYPDFLREVDQFGQPLIVYISLWHLGYNRPPDYVRLPCRLVRQIRSYHSPIMERKAESLTDRPDKPIFCQHSYQTICTACHLPGLRGEIAPCPAAQECACRELRFAHPSHRRRWAPSAHNAADGMVQAGAFLSPLTDRQAAFHPVSADGQAGSL